MSVQGKVVWHDLMTKNLEGSKAFYGELFGWRLQKQGPWSFLCPADSDQHFGTMMMLESTQPMPSHWVPYITVDDIDAALKAIPAHGGVLHTGKMAAGETGHFAVAADPQGATFTVWQYNGAPKSTDTDTPPPPGHFCWAELHTSDPEAAEKFYGAVFGYSIQHMEMPGMKYTIFLRDSKRADGSLRQGGGMMKMQEGISHPFWLSYVAVADCDASVTKATQLGANIVAPPTNIPNVGRFSMMLDPTHAAIAVLGPNK
jgi:uncharacterized protein